jgi:hypothetical protein
MQEYYYSSLSLFVLKIACVDRRKPPLNQIRIEILQNE